MTCPTSTAALAAVTVAVNVISVPELTVVTAPLPEVTASVVVVDTGAGGATGAAGADGPLPHPNVTTETMVKDLRRFIRALFTRLSTSAMILGRPYASGLVKLGGKNSCGN